MQMAGSFKRSMTGIKKEKRHSVKDRQIPLTAFRRCPKALPKRSKTRRVEISNCVKWLARGTNLSTCHACTERVFTDSNFLIYVRICKIVLSASHRSNEYGDVMGCGQGRQIFREPLHWGVTRKSLRGFSMNQRCQI